MEDILVVRVDKSEFELNDGRIYQHPIELDEEPNLEEFNEWYKNSREAVNDLIISAEEVHEAYRNMKKTLVEEMTKHEPNSDNDPTDC